VFAAWLPEQHIELKRARVEDTKWRVYTDLAPGGHGQMAGGDWLAKALGFDVQEIIW
jgi:hypothetical protein